MGTLQHAYCILLAGGVGRRLWPASQKARPKQFLDFFGAGRTLLQQTFDRFAAFIPTDHIFVTTFEDYVPLVRQQLPTLPAANILPEPVRLNTAPAAIWGTWHAAMADPEASVVVSPCDQWITDDARFAAEITAALDYVATHERFLAIGVRPSMPNTEYGYIQMGDAADAPGLYTVQSFSEKPETELAQVFMESGEFLWNTGIHLWRAETLNRYLSAQSGRAEQSVDKVARQMITIAEEVALVRSRYSEGMPKSVSLLVLEHCPGALVMECTFGWADIGRWTEVRDHCRTDVDGNAVSGDARVLFSGTSHTIVRLPSGRKAVIAGLDDYIVAEEGDTLLVCPNSNPDAVRRLINEALVEL